MAAMLSQMEILSTNRFRDKFYRCLSRRLRKLQMAVPYITGIPPYKSLPYFAHVMANRGCELDIVTGPPGGGNGALSTENADLMMLRKASLFIRRRPFMHAKVYQFIFIEGDRAAFVGSANFTNGGFGKNDEIVAFSSEKRYNEGVAREFVRLKGAGSTEYHLWKIREGVAWQAMNNLG